MNQMMSRYPQTECTQSRWRKFVRSAPFSYDNLLAVVNWKRKETPTVDEVAIQLRQYEESLSSFQVSAVEKLLHKVQ